MNAYTIQEMISSAEVLQGLMVTPGRVLHLCTAGMVSGELWDCAPVQLRLNDRTSLGQASQAIGGAPSKWTYMGPVSATVLDVLGFSPESAPPGFVAVESTVHDIGRTRFQGPLYVLTDAGRQRAQEQNFDTLAAVFLA